MIRRVLWGMTLASPIAYLGGHAAGTGDLAGLVLTCIGLVGLCRLALLAVIEDEI